MIVLMKTTKIYLNNMIFYGYHGVFPEEQVLGQRFEVDVEYKFPLPYSSWEDQLLNTISYAHVYELVSTIVHQHRFQLLETLADQIISTINEKYTVDQILVRIRKPSAPIQGVLDHVEVELCWQKDPIS